MPELRSLDEYLQLLDWTGRELATGKRGAIPAHLEPILTRLGIPSSHWLDLTQNFGRHFQPTAGGCRFEAWAYPLAVGEKLPTLPIWLTDELAVSVDLDVSYEETCRVLRIPTN